MPTTAVSTNRPTFRSLSAVIALTAHHVLMLLRIFFPAVRSIFESDTLLIAVWLTAAIAQHFFLGSLNNSNELVNCLGWARHITAAFLAHHQPTRYLQWPVSCASRQGDRCEL